MKLLICTQKVDKNDDILGFFHSWLVEFANRVDSLIVVCLEKGDYDLPKNVTVLSLGKEKGVSKVSYIFSFYKYIFQNKNKYDSVFVHMNPEYLVLGGLLWRIWSKKIGLWYVHKQMNLKLRIGSFFSHIIFTASEHSFKLKTNKLEIVGHGIDVDRFKSVRREDDGVFKLLTVGRIARSKQVSDVIHAAHVLKDMVQKRVEVVVVGKPYTEEDKKYLEELKRLTQSLGMDNDVKFVGSVPNKDMAEYYNSATVTVNPSHTGGMDKVVLEAFASRIPTMFTFESFDDLCGEYTSLLKYEIGDYNQLAEKIISLLERKDLNEVLDFLAQRVDEGYSINALIPKITNIYETS